MERRRTASILDGILLFCGMWLLGYLWTRFYVMNLLIAIIVASIISIFFSMLFYLSRQKNNIKRKKQRLIDTIMNQFLFASKDFAMDFLFLALKSRFGDKNRQLADKNFEKNEASKKERESKLQKNSVACIKRTANMILVGSTAITAKFTVEQLPLDGLIEYYVSAKKMGAKRLLILSLAGFNKSALQYIHKLPDIKIDIFDKNKSYDFFGWLGHLPAITVVLENKKPSLRSFFASALSPKKRRRYILISILLMLSSYFVAYSIYYIVAASLALTLAILSTIKKPQSKGTSS